MSEAHLRSAPAMSFFLSCLAIVIAGAAFVLPTGPLEVRRRKGGSSGKHHDDDDDNETGNSKTGMIIGSKFQSLILCFITIHTLHISRNRDTRRYWTCLVILLV